jgi:hypothetical protein
VYSGFAQTVREIKCVCVPPALHVDARNPLEDDQDEARARAENPHPHEHPESAKGGRGGRNVRKAIEERAAVSHPAALDAQAVVAAGRKVSCTHRALLANSLIAEPLPLHGFDDAARPEEDLSAKQLVALALHEGSGGDVRIADAAEDFLLIIRVILARVPVVRVAVLDAVLAGRALALVRVGACRAVALVARAVDANGALALRQVVPRESLRTPVVSWGHTIGAEASAICTKRERGPWKKEKETTPRQGRKSNYSPQSAEL